MKWRSLTEEERERYCSEAATHNCGDATVNIKKETDRTIRHMVDIIRLTVRSSDLMLKMLSGYRKPGVNTRIEINFIATFMHFPFMVDCI